MSPSLLQTLVLTHCLAVAAVAHVVITYPGWRGNNLHITDDFPFGMQWAYPCGGLQETTNRTYWPLDGGAVAFQPGWFTGHLTALMYINIGLGDKPDNYSWPVTKFYLRGPTNNPYPGSVCLPKLDLPENIRNRVKSGDRVTMQIIETMSHGAALYSCADVILTDDPSKVPPVTEQNCFNATDISLSDVAVLGVDELPAACSGAGLAVRTSEDGEAAATMTGTGTDTLPPMHPPPVQPTALKNTLMALGKRHGMSIANMEVDFQDIKSSIEDWQEAFGNAG
ncbi:hypothetical protein VTJ49DRAFT_3002 [Mycothermus thermophilus]|uniref:Copper acquisition factor BIM1-like domain-containing protein n=1 Tax=Humicola insolens TaxID=85995 RepID=A0ABR3V8N2_HUMIN